MEAGDELVGEGAEVAGYEVVVRSVKFQAAALCMREGYDMRDMDCEEHLSVDILTNLVRPHELRQRRVFGDCLAFFRDDLWEINLEILQRLAPC